ncbi:MAG: tetratricopeptide repeat protein [Burkholderiaceae bacterium]
MNAITPAMEKSAPRGIESMSQHNSADDRGASAQTGWAIDNEKANSRNSVTRETFMNADPFAGIRPPFQDDAPSNTRVLRNRDESSFNAIAPSVNRSKDFGTGVSFLCAPRELSDGPSGGSLSNGIRFGRFELRLIERVLLDEGVPVAIGARAFDVLSALVEHHGHLVTKREILDLAWPGLVVEENNLAVQVSTLRKVLGADAIVTVAGRGYRFCVPITDALDTSRFPTNRIAIDDARVEATSAAELLQQNRRCVLGAAIRVRAGDERAAGADAMRAAREVVVLSIARLAPRFGGTTLGDPRFAGLASFPSARAAVACALQMRDVLDEPHSHGARIGSRLRLAIVSVDHGSASFPTHSANALLTLIERTGDGATCASESTVAQCIAGLDCDIDDLGLLSTGPLSNHRVYGLSAPARVRGPVLEASHELRPTLAVLPFHPYDRDDASLRLGDVLTDQVIAALSHSDAVNVTSRLSTHAFRDRPMALQEMARLLGVRYFVSARYGRSGDTIRLHVELADSTNGEILWTETVCDDAKGALQTDSLLIQEIATGISRALISREIRSMRQAPLPTLASHTLLLAAIGLVFRLSQSEFGRARDALETLHVRAPRHPAPLAWLARWHLFRVVQGWSENRQEDGEIALSYASRALELDPDSSLALTMLGNVHVNHLRDLDRAETLYDQAIAINPNESIAWLHKGNARSFRADGCGAVTHVRKALALSPLDPARHFYQGILAGATLSAGDYDGAIAAARSALRINRGHVSAHRVLAIALSLQGRLDEAREVIRDLRVLEPTLNVTDFIARSPAAGYGLIERFGHALQAAGLPLSRNTSI